MYWLHYVLLGFGTLDEFYEAITLVQTKKISGFPIIIFDKDFYQNILEHNQMMLEAGTSRKMMKVFTW